MKEEKIGVKAQYKASTTISERAYMKNTTRKNNSVQGIHKYLRAYIYKGYHGEE